MTYNGEISIKDDLVLNYDYIPEDKSIYIKGEITSTTVGALRSFFKIVKEPVCTIFINSPGGSFLDVMAMIDLMENSSKKVNISVTGIAFSSAAFFTICATGTRNMLPNSYMMFHDISKELIKEDFPTAQNLTNRNKLLEEIQEKFYDRLMEHSQLSKYYSIDQLKKELQHEFYVNREDSLKYHLIDGSP